MKTPHPRLVPLLLKYGIDWALFQKKGRPPEGVRAARSAIVTELHDSGCSWAEMCEITGLSNPSIQRLTQAKGCDAVRQKRLMLGKSVGSSWRGKHRPGQLERQWASGIFDFHRGRVRSPEERAILKAGWTQERRAKAGAHSKRLWSITDFRDHLMAFHRSPEERARRSHDQTKRMAEHPGIFLHGKAQWMDTSKGSVARIFVRSSYEAAAVRLLEGDPRVFCYEYERRFPCADGTWILPDFIVHYSDGSTRLIEVKASWVFRLPPSHRIHKRLAQAQEIAAQNGWYFGVWSEKELKDAFQRTA